MISDECDEDEQLKNSISGASFDAGGGVERKVPIPSRKDLSIPKIILIVITLNIRRRRYPKLPLFFSSPFSGKKKRREGGLRDETGFHSRERMQRQRRHLPSRRRRRSISREMISDECDEDEQLKNSISGASFDADGGGGGEREGSNSIPQRTFPFRK
ncbi:hypothetical protein CDAR_487131 [Caerostris darwini]|uniref:Uncharacterized protein n=1 Tax=Caerostris darwini TaxID=1538125 RepID=A0AAV4TYH9_9ARAC|nr:hypothetical protein CDAR_487131 [Caerostris darwini]